MWRLLLVLALVLTGCASQDAKKDGAKPAERYDSMLRDVVANIKPDNGIGYSEAMAITKYYLARFSRADAMVIALEDQGRYWEAQVQFRAIASLASPIQVDKNTGGVRWSQGPTMKNLAELLAK